MMPVQTEVNKSSQIHLILEVIFQGEGTFLAC